MSSLSGEPMELSPAAFDLDHQLGGRPGRCCMARSTRRRAIEGATTSESRVVKSTAIGRPRYRWRGLPARQRQKGSAGFQRGWGAGELVLLELRHRARHRSCACGCWAPTASPVTPHIGRGDQTRHSYSNTVTLAVDPRQRLRDQAREHIELVRQEILELEEDRPAATFVALSWTGPNSSWCRAPALAAWHRLRPLLSAGGNMAEDRGARNGDGRPCPALSRTVLQRLSRHIACRRCG